MHDSTTSLISLATGLVLVLSGCGDDGSGDAEGTGTTSTSSTTDPTAMTTTDASATVFTVDDSTTADPDSSDGADSETGDSTGEPPVLEDFSFFLTSLAGLQELSGDVNGFGGDLSYDGEVGIAGADRICETLAEMSMPGSAVKQWRAFLSTSTEDAIDRIGAGPWYDRNGRLLAQDIEGLLMERPDGDPTLVDDFANEWGVPNSTPEGKMLDNHDTMTGSGQDGRLLLMGGGGGPGGGTYSTCNDWTDASPGQDPPAVGHSWPSMSGMSWLFVGRHANGCEPLVWLEQTGANCDGQTGVGCGGGYGGFYCFALQP